MSDSKEPKLYSVMPAGHSHAGWIYMGPSKTTEAPLYAASEDAGVFNFNKAASLAAEQNARLPSDKELDQMLEAKDKGALKGTFNVSGSRPAGWYSTASEYPGNPGGVWGRRASNGAVFQATGATTRRGALFGTELFDHCFSMTRNLNTPNSETSLQMAAETGNLAELKLLHLAGADPMKVSDQGLNTIGFAICSAFTPRLRYLIDECGYPLPAG